MNKRRNICCAAALLTALCMILPGFCAASAETDYSVSGGGYAAVGQIEGVGCTTEIYDAGNGLPTSDAMFLLSASEEEEEQLRQKPVLSAEILSGITEFPYLSACARAAHEWYDGSGYPSGLREKAIPEIARIIAVAEAYDTMISGSSTHDPLSYQVVREEFVKQSGTQFDPVYAEIMVQLMDSDHAE